MHWSEKWIGRPYDRDSFDCAVLVQDVVREMRGMRIALPNERDWRKVTPQLLRDFAASFAKRTDRPVDGDCVLMKYFGHVQAHGSHVGIYAKVQGSDWVLHNTEHLGVIFHPVSALRSRTLVLEGYYSWME